MFDRCRITSCSCTCGAGAKWCAHVVALCLFRIHNVRSWRFTYWLLVRESLGLPYFATQKQAVFCTCVNFFLFSWFALNNCDTKICTFLLFNTNLIQFHLGLLNYRKNPNHDYLKPLSISHVFKKFEILEMLLLIFMKNWASQWNECVLLGEGAGYDAIMVLSQLMLFHIRWKPKLKLYFN